MTRQSQQGMAVLPVALILLAAAALVLLFAQKNLLVDLRITQNGYTSRLAYAAADSGLAAMMARLNDPAQRKTILAESQGTGAYDVVATPALTVSLGDSLEASVKLKGLSLGRPDIRLQLQSTGCVSGCSQGRAHVTQTVAMRGGIHQVPYALLTARGNINVTGPVHLTNQSASVSGMLTHAGAGIQYDEAVQRVSVPGRHPDLAEVAQDKKLAQLSADAYFLQWFGADKAFIREQAAHLSCEGECSGAVAALGSRVIWLEGNARLSSGTLGTHAAPVIIIAGGTLQITGSVAITGIVYSAAPVTSVRLGSGRLDGALIAENQLEIAQGGVLTYNPVVLQRAQSALGTFVAVPGSWSDGE